MTSIDHAVEILNEALRLEPKAISDLVRYRVRFASEDLAEHPTIQIGETGAQGSEQPFDLGFLGILNGIFGTASERVSIEVEDDFYDNPERLIEVFQAHHHWTVGTPRR